MAGPPAAAMARGFSKGSLEKNPLLGQWLSLAEPGVVQVRMGKVEFGQGIGTALAQIVAEELDLDLSRITLAPVSTGLSPDEGVTSGSLSVQHSGDALRLVCASLRELAVARFCARHGLQPAAVHIHDGRLQAADGAAEQRIAGA